MTNPASTNPALTKQGPAKQVPAKQVKIKTVAVCLIALIVIGTSQLSYGAGSGGGGGSFNTGPAESTLTPEQQSERAFRQGVKHRDRALKQEEKAHNATSEKKRTRALTRVEKEFQKAIKKQGQALSLDPKNYKAANELGYALRKTGDFRKAIGAYNYALEINPDFHQATEYRAQAFLTLGYYELAQEAYMTLFRADRALADELMIAFETWQENNTDKLDDAQTAFVSWVEERKKLAQATQDLSINNTRSW